MTILIKLILFYLNINSIMFIDKNNFMISFKFKKKTNIILSTYQGFKLKAIISFILIFIDVFNVVHIKCVN